MLPIVAHPIPIFRADYVDLPTGEHKQRCYLSQVTPKMKYAEVHTVIDKIYAKRVASNPHQSEPLIAPCLKLPYENHANQFSFADQKIFQCQDSLSCLYNLLKKMISKL